MILFIVIAVCILLYTLFADDWLIYHIKRDAKGPRPCREILNDLGCWLLGVVFFNILNAMATFVISIAMLVVLANTCPSETTHWKFDINALQDNLVTEGEFYGRRGSVDGELSYFYSRSTSLGEKIGHIPADKTYVRYSDVEQPHVEVYESRIDIPEWLCTVFVLKPFNDKSVDYYVLTLPRGSIMNTDTYEIDMQ